MAYNNIFSEKKPLVISGSTKRIDDNSMGFMSCSDIIIEEGVEEIGGWAFTCSSVDGAVIPSTVRKIEENPFPHTHIFKVRCSSPYYTVKDDILIENSTMRLVSFVGKDHYSGKDAFNREGVEPDLSRYEFIVPSYIKILGQGCFRGRKLDKITIPSTVEKILENPFVECSAEIVNLSPNYILKDGLLYEPSTNTLLSYVGKDKDIVVPEGIEIIEGSTFELLEYGVRSITLPTSVKEIRGNFGEECDLEFIFVPKKRINDICKLLPKYQDKIKEVGFDPDKEIRGRHAKEEASRREFAKRKEKLEKEIKEINYKPNYLELVFMFVVAGGICGGITYLVGSLCSWSFYMPNWNIVSKIIAGILALISFLLTFAVVISSYRDGKKEAERKVRSKFESEEKKINLARQIKESGGILKCVADLVDALSYPIKEEGDTWVTLRITDTSYIKLEQSSWNHQMVTYCINENGKCIEQRQSFKTMGYMPMIAGREEIIQTIKEKIWNFGLAEKPKGNVKSQNTYSEIACLFRDIYVIAYRNEGRISEKTNNVIKSFAKQKCISEEQLSHYGGWDGTPSAFILDCYPEYEFAKDDYLKEVASIYRYTLKKDSSQEAYIYLCEIASKLGKTEEDIKKYI